MIHRIAMALALSVPALLASPAAALDSRRAEAVVLVLEQLSPARGETVFYDEEAAAEWYEFDAENASLIPAAGFSEESWAESYEATLKGMMALMSDAEFDAAHAGFEKHVNELPGLTDAQRAEAIGEWNTQLARVAVYRAEGRPHTAVLRNLEKRLRVLAGL